WGPAGGGGGQGTDVRGRSVRSGGSPIAGVAFGVEPVAERVAEKVACDDDERDGKAWHEREPLRVPDLAAALLEERAPRVRERRAEAEERERGLDEDHAAEAEAHLDEDRREEVRHDVAAHD